MPREAGVLKPCARDVAILQPLSLAAIPTHSQHDHLLVADACRIPKTVHADVTELRRQYLAAVGNVFSRDDQHQNATRFQPAPGVAEKDFLHAAVLATAKFPVIGRVQVQQRETLDRTVSFERISLDYHGHSFSGLFCPISVDLDPIPQHVGIGSDSGERDAIADARIERCPRHLGKLQKTSDTTRLSRWEWVEAKARPAGKSHENAPFSKVRWWYEVLGTEEWELRKESDRLWSGFGQTHILLMQPLNIMGLCIHACRL
jgi:hypothetical protein